VDYGQGGVTLRIGPVAHRDQSEALRLVLPDLRDSERTDLFAGSPDGWEAIEGLFAAHRRQQMVGAVWAQLQPGATAVLWPPGLAAPADEQAAAELLEVACGFLSRQPISMAQSVLLSRNDPQAARLGRVGFAPLADLAYLVATRARFPAVRPGPPVLEFESYQTRLHERLTSIVLRTYQQTLDCPQLSGARDVNDVLRGYRDTGRFAPDHWQFVRHQARDIGCLLLADFPETGHMELVYMGIVPEARGHGWGIEIARHAMWVARQADRSRLVLAVDQQNTPALAMYELACFVTWERRTVFVRRFAS